MRRWLTAEPVYLFLTGRENMLDEPGYNDSIHDWDVWECKNCGVKSNFGKTASGIGSEREEYTVYCLNPNCTKHNVLRKVTKGKFPKEIN